MTLFDPVKDETNRRKHGIGLSDFSTFDDFPDVEEDTHRDYGERRFRAFGRIAGKPYCLAYNVRGTDIRLISFRRAHENEMRRHER